MPPRRRREPVRGGGPWRRRPRAQPCLAALHPQCESGPFSDAPAGAEEGYAGAGAGRRSRAPRCTASTPDPHLSRVPPPLGATLDPPPGPGPTLRLQVGCGARPSGGGRRGRR